MNQKNKKNRKPSKPKLSIEAQEKQTRALFAEKKYKNALTACKSLLKQDKRPEWLELLSAIYEGRARELADKKMHKEAVMILRNRAEICGTPLLDTFYFHTLYAANMFDQIRVCYLENTAELDRLGISKDVRELLAAHSLATPDSPLKGLPADDLIAKDHPNALAALDAYCAGNDELSHTHLKMISFRSPFRDFRQILKALLSSENDEQEAKKLISRVSPSSPFIHLAETASASFDSGTQAIDALLKLKPEALLFVSQKRGYDKSLSKLVAELGALGDSSQTESLLSIVLRYKTLLGLTRAREFAIVILMHSSSSVEKFVKAFGMPEEIERTKIDALGGELHKLHPLELVNIWEAVGALLAPKNCDSPEDYHLVLALIARRKLKLLDKIPDSGVSKAPLLEEVLTHDPLDHESYVTLIAFYREHGELKKARHWVELALKNFPAEMPILEEAVETALASKAYKKAATLATRVLEKDPINRRIRTALIDAHSSHARKLIGNKKHALAEKELDIAASWVKVPADNARIDLVRGTALLDQGDASKTGDIWADAAKNLGGGLCGHFYLLLELLRQNRSVNSVLSKTKNKLLVKALTQEHLADFFQLLSKRSEKTESDHVFGALQFLNAALKKGAKFSYSVSESEVICETLSRFGQNALLSSYIKQACKQWPNEPVFIYHMVSLETTKRGYLSDKDWGILDSLLDRIEETTNKKLIGRIKHLIETTSMPDYFYEDEDEDDDEDEGFFDGLMPPLDDLVDLLLDTMPKKDMKEMKQRLGEEGAREFLREMISNNMLDENDDEEDFSTLLTLAKKKKKAPKDDEPHNADDQMELL